MQPLCPPALPRCSNPPSASPALRGPPKSSPSTLPSTLTHHFDSVATPQLPPLHPWLSRSPLSLLGSLCSAAVPVPGVLPPPTLVLSLQGPPGSLCCPQHSLGPLPPVTCPGPCPVLSPWALLGCPLCSLPVPCVLFPGTSFHEAPTLCVAARCPTHGVPLCPAPLQHPSPVFLVLRDPIVTSRLRPLCAALPCIPFQC